MHVLSVKMRITSLIASEFVFQCLKMINVRSRGGIFLGCNDLDVDRISINTDRLTAEVTGVVNHANAFHYVVNDSRTT